MKKAVIILLLLAGAAAGLAGTRFMSGTGTVMETLAAEPEGRTRISARILSITGNRMTYRKLADLTETGDTAEESPEAGTAEEESGGKRPEDLPEERGEEAPDTGAETGETAEEESGRKRPEGMPEERGQNSPDGAAGGNETAEGTASSEERGRKKPEGMPEERSGEAPSDSGSGRKRGGSRPGEENQTEILIPVSVPVWSGTGKEFNYTVLQAGDTITIQTDRAEDGTEVITGIWLTAGSE